MKLFLGLWGGGHPFTSLPFDEDVVVSRPEELEGEGTLIIWGGADISPTIYGKKVSRHTGAGERLSHRDAAEVALMKRAIELEMPIVGVCRGAQLLCALAGGHLIQDVQGHSGSHEVKTYDGKTIVTNSIHHQMMYPFNVEHKIRAWMEKPLSTHYIDVDEDGRDFNNTVKLEPEYVYFPKIKGYAVQWHPEGMRLESPANQWLLNDLKKGIFNHVEAY